MQNQIENWAMTQTLLRPDGKLIAKLGRRTAVGYMRFANKLILLHREISVLESCQKILQEFLFDRGLKVTFKKIKHTRLVFNQEQPGFDFLGFTIKHYDTYHRSALNTNGKRLGYKLLIYPSRKSVNNHFNIIKKEIKKYKTRNASSMIKRLNPIIISWTNFFRFSHFLSVNASSMEHRLYLMLVHWAKKNLNAESLGPGYRKFWKRVYGRLYFSCIKRKKKASDTKFLL
jgi:RNA-directed DNA polymerase